MRGEYEAAASLHRDGRKKQTSIEAAAASDCIEAASIEAQILEVTTK